MFRAFNARKGLPGIKVISLIKFLHYDRTIGEVGHMFGTPKNL